MADVRHIRVTMSLFINRGIGRMKWLLIFSVLLEWSHKGSLLLVSLESSVTKLGSCINELEIDNLKSSLLGVSQQRLSKGQDSLLRSNTTTLHHQEILLNFSDKSYSVAALFLTSFPSFILKPSPIL